LVELLSSLKNFLADRPEFAFLALSLGTNVVLFKLYVREKDAHLATVLEWLPLAEKLTNILAAAAAKARVRRGDDNLVQG
jgi:hypothetical protein